LSNKITTTTKPSSNALTTYPFCQSFLSVFNQMMMYRGYSVECGFPTLPTSYKNKNQPQNNRHYCDACCDHTFGLPTTCSTTRECLYSFFRARGLCRLSPTESIVPGTVQV
jgi:hypothetical protein